MDFAARFAALDAWLCEHQALWRAKPFTQLTLAWEADWPALAAWLRERSLEQAEREHNQPWQLSAPAPFPALAAQAQALSAVEDWSGAVVAELPELLSRHIPGRKWQQITRFAAASRQRWQRSPSHWLDWCAGKGHLGRLLAWQSALPLTCLERDPQLNFDGAAMSRQHGIAARHLDADVLQPAAWQQLRPEHSLLALHACGELHMTLLREGAARGCAQLAVSPCCYNRISISEYQPMSQRVARSALRLSEEDLRLPLQETVTSGQRVRRLRDQSMAWRLAFDLWQRQARGVDRYLSTPSRPESALNQGFEAFCRDMAAHHQLELQPPACWAELEQQGWQRLAVVRNLELVRALFRRPLEIWLLLDRALFLQEQGYQVQLGQFCPPALTPRNLLIVAERN